MNGRSDPQTPGSKPTVGLLPQGTRLHHLALGAQQPERVAAFYRELFGLCEVARHFELGSPRRLRSIWLDLGGSVLMVERTQLPLRRVEGVGSGPFLLAFHVSEEQREAVESRLEALGGEVESRSQFTSYCRDPEGNRVAFSHYPLAASIS